MTRLLDVALLFVWIYLQQNYVKAYLYTCNVTAPCGCSGKDTIVNARITGGEIAGRHSWPWAVSLRILDNEHFCGGTIISEHYVLTAAHCVDNPAFSRIELSVVVGTDNLGHSSGQQITVSRIYIHSGWNSKTNENDIALLRLEKAIPFYDKTTAKLCLPDLTNIDVTDFPTVSSKLTAIGWGDTSSGGSESYDLRQVTIDAVGSDEQKCRSVIHNKRLQFCAAAIGGGKDTCQGDSGGPLMYHSDTYKRWILAGITSYGHGCGLLNYAGVYTRVSMYVTWAQEIIGTDGVTQASTRVTTRLPTAGVPTAGVVTDRENGASISSISNVFWIFAIAFSVFMRSL